MRQPVKPPPRPDYFAKKRQCLELAIKREAREEANRGAMAGTVDLKSEQCYVPSMDTCIYESGFFVSSVRQTSMTVEDLLTGRVLAGGPANDASYIKERERLFNLCAK